VSAHPDQVATFDIAELAQSAFERDFDRGQSRIDATLGEEADAMNSSLGDRDAIHTTVQGGRASRAEGQSDARGQQLSSFHRDYSNTASARRSTESGNAMP